ncbi:MAG: DegT/DnrJ/EryC1/StrS family aminotransferase [Phaeodactylibacter xiamenensis]|uniref:Pleiotropic regulatory protein n=1 Tax=Phaeodactylibacter xiamenensis TaxID=1524460 RepID=A0A098RZR5_9BACT|nr:DegT/DnrJ/EryC1/StrS family aminotransferase [Phaeodactylibacter xiamenensis]KGE85649.1 Pleiotropic regulatory protein [Phaeodactylibacter xiamenensis]MCR9054234.1 DegT/DnrJ/EryC1/StrS family aminotransferase [bacterium]
MSDVKMNIQMVDLKTQYERLKPEIDAAVQEVLQSCAYINGPAVKSFKAHMESYLDARHVIPCANGTDALQIALMGVGLQPGDEVIVPAFTYVSTAEVIALLNLKPVMVDVDPDTFNVTADLVEAAITPKTKAVVPVNLFGQSCDLEPIMEVAKAHGLWVIEDNAQAIGADYTFKDGHTQKTGTIGHIGCTSFYPSKNLGAYGDGGALYTNDEALGQQLQMIANHGQVKRYYHDMVGVNSRLDSIQAAILDIKLAHLDEYAAARRSAANYYDQAFAGIEGLQTPARDPKSTHVFHQYTLKVANGKRDALQKHLQEAGIPNMIYYPVPLYKQKAYQQAMDQQIDYLPVTEDLCNSVISLPMHTELDEPTLAHIADQVKAFFQK